MTIIEQDMIGLRTEPMPVVNITAFAADRLTSMMKEKELDGYALRVFVSGGGCSGMQYGMTFDNELRDGDNQVEQHGLRIVVDPISMRYLSGASIDFVDSLMGGGFKIDNPNAVSACGCGHSFRTSETEGDDEAMAGGGGGCGSCGH